MISVSLGPVSRMNGPEGPIYTFPGAAPMPGPSGNGTAGTGRPTLILGLVMMGWLVAMMALAAFGGGTGEGTAARATIDRGVVVTPAAGWTSATDEWDVGPGAISLKRAGVVVAFAAQAYEGTAQALLTGQQSALESEFRSFRGLPAGKVTVAGGLTGLETLFSGVAQGGRLEGEIVAVVHNGSGVVMVAVAPFGQLRLVQDDIDQMLDTLVIP